MKNKPDFLTDVDYNLLKSKYSNEEIDRIIESNYPIQYAIGDVQFLNTKIKVDERVLIPRFSTELLVDKLIKYIKERSLGSSSLLDLCTGSGAISIALKGNLSNLDITAVDISKNALTLAQENAKLNNTSINFIEKDILKDMTFDKKFSIIVSNPPYVKLNEMVSPNIKFEPQIALYPGEDDLIFYKTILKNSRNILTSKNIIAFEIGSTQGKQIIKYVREYYPNSIISLEKDYEGFDRYIFIFNE